MQVACPDCATSYQVDPSTLGRTGRSVRCLRCRHVWFAANIGAMSAIAQAYRADVRALAPDPEQTGAGTAAGAEAADSPPLPLRKPPILITAPPIVPTHPGEKAVRPIDLTDVMSAAVRRAERRPAHRRWRLPWRWSHSMSR